MNNITSLKSAIVFRLIIPIMLFIIIIDGLSSYFITLHNVEETYDRWLLDSARSLEQEVNVVDNQISVKLSNTALKIFKWNEEDSTYFKIQAENKGFLVGDLPLQGLPPPSKGRQLSFSNIFFNGEEMRMVSLRVSGNLPENVTIHVAETLNKRRERFVETLIIDLTPELIFTMLIGLLLYHGANRGLAPLGKLAEDIAQRSPSDLSPISEAHVFEEVRILTDTINSLFLKLSSSMTAQQRFIANAAHQLRTPLAGLKLQAERAQREEGIEAMRPALSQIQHSADRISHMINQLLVLARSGQVEGSHSFERIDLLSLTKAICMEWAPKVLEKNISLSFEPLEHSIFIEGDKVLLAELLSNLLANAIAYGNQQGNILVKLTTQPSPCLTVEDDGPGINDAEVKKVFERFYRIPGSTGQGCGLGLAIVKEIADLHQIRLNIGKSTTGGVLVELRFLSLVSGMQ